MIKKISYFKNIINSLFHHPITMESKDLCLVFDTETSGLFPRNPKSDISTYPYITQLSFILYDTKNNTVVKQYNSYIQQTVEHDYDNEAFKITKITKEMCAGGVPITAALSELYQNYIIAGTVIAHNLKFDKKMIQLEILRNYHLLKASNDDCVHVMFNDTFNEMFGINTYCTMMAGKDILNVWIKDKRGQSWKKSPKLAELYVKLFEEEPENLHDSLIDTKVCLMCYVKMKFDKMATVEI